MVEIIKSLRIIYALLLVGLIITIFIVYKDTSDSSPFAIKFVIGYMIFLVLFCLYSFFTITLKLRHLKSVEIRKRLYKFTGYFIGFLVVNVVVDHFFKPTINVLNDVSIAFGLSFGISFLDLIFLEKKQDF